MGAEILRAVLDQSCSFSQPVFYTVDVTAGPGGANGATFATQFQCKQDRYFLLTGIGSGVIVAATGMQDQSAGQLQIYALAANRFIYNSGPVPNMLTGQDFNVQLTLPEYVLINPAESLRVEVFIPAGVAGPLIYPITLYGIEYAR
jgi:hypothetical protein